MPRKNIGNFFLYFYPMCIKIICMKCKLQIFCLLLCLMSGAASATGFAEFDLLLPNDISETGSFSNVLINKGYDYSLQHLDEILVSGANISVDYNLVGGNLNNVFRFVADSGFDGGLDADIELSNPVSFKLSGSYLATHTNEDEIMRVNNISVVSGTISYEEDAPYSDHIYKWENCASGTGKCLKRVWSNAHNQAVAQEHNEQMVVAYGAQNNPKILLRPMNIINQSELISYYDFSDELFVSVMPEYYTNSDFNSYGLRLNSGMAVIGNLSVGIGAYAFRGNFKNSFSDFESDVYGGNLRANYVFDNLMFVRGIAGVSMANIKCDGVIDGNNLVNNPRAFGVYAGLDVGAKFDFESGMFLSPFVGMGVINETVVDVNQNDLFLRVGNDFGFKYFMDGVSYNYILRVGVNSNGYLDANVGAGMWTVSDKIGGDVSIGVMDSEFGWSAKISGNLRFAF